MAVLAFVELGGKNNQMGKEYIIHTCFGESTGSRSPWRVNGLIRLKWELSSGEKKEKNKNPKPFNRAVVDMPKIIQLTQDQR